MVAIRHSTECLLMATLCTLVCMGLALPGRAQADIALCNADASTPSAERENIFSAQQELWLSSVIRDSIASSLTLVTNPAQDDRLRRLSDRLSQVNQQATVRFTVHVISAPELNGFSIPDGQIYLTQLLIEATRDDDELAFVLAHEMGHVICHHLAIQSTSTLKQGLGVAQRADPMGLPISSAQLLSRELRLDGWYSHRESDQRQADQVAVALMKRAGYRPEASLVLWQRLVQKQSLRNPGTSSDQDRLRSCNLQKLVSGQPGQGQACSRQHNDKSFLQRFLERVLIPASQ